MYVCICNKVTDTQIVRAVKNGVTTMGELNNQLNVASKCGKCKNCARRLLNTKGGTHAG
jgi:bacterioferritin-associated ferredoxin